MKPSETQLKLKRIPFYRRLWNKWFGWKRTELPIVRQKFTGIPTKIIEMKPMDSNISGLLFYLDFEVRPTYLDKGIDFTAKQIVKGII
jgi:hypothetical protein